MAITPFYEQVWVENTLDATPALQVGSSTHSGDSTIYGTLSVTNVAASGAVGAGLLVVSGNSTFLGNVSISSPGVLTTGARASFAGGFTAASGTITGTGTIGTLSVSNGATLGSLSVSGTSALSGAVTFSSATPASFLNGLTTTNVTASGTSSAFPALAINGNPSIAVQKFVDLQNQTGFVTEFIHGTTTKVGKVGAGTIDGTEYLGAYVLKSNVGSTATLNSANKVALYAETQVAELGAPGTHTSGSGPAWSLNSLLFIDSTVGTLTTGTTIPGTWAATGYELDINNQSSLAFGSSTVAGTVVGLNISAGGLNSVTAAMTVNGVDTIAATSNLFQTGISFQAGSVNASSITDYTNASFGHYIGGSKYWGIDLQGLAVKAGGSSLRIGTYATATAWAASTSYLAGDRRANNANIYVVTAAGTSAASGGPTNTGTAIVDGTVTWAYKTPVSVARVNAYDPWQATDVQVLAFSNPGTSSTTGILALGSSNAGTIQVGNTILPATSNAQSLGSSSAYFLTGYITDMYGTVHAPSSAALKGNISDLPPMLPLVKALTPRSYTWLPGTIDLIEVASTVMVQEFEEVPISEPRIEMRDGVPIRTIGESVERRPVFDEVPVLNDDGSPAMVHGTEQPAEYDENGNLVREAVAAVSRQLTHRTPRMVPQQSVIQQPVAKPDERTHFGFLASDVKNAFLAAGIDYGGYTMTKDGVEGIRYDQQVAVLWKAVQELAQRLEVLERSTPT